MAKYRRKGRGGPRSARQRAALRKAQLVSARKRRRSKLRTVVTAAGAVIGTGIVAKSTYYAFHPNGFPAAKRDFRDMKAGYSAVKGWVFGAPKTINAPSPVKPRGINPYRLKPRHTANGKRRSNRLGY